MIDSHSFMAGERGNIIQFAVLDERGSIARRFAFRILAGVWTHGIWCSYALILAGSVALGLAHDAIGLASRLEMERVLDQWHDWESLSRLVIAAAVAALLFCLAVLVPLFLRRLCAFVVQEASLCYLGREPPAARPSNGTGKDWAAQAALSVLAGSATPEHLMYERGSGGDPSDDSDVARARSWRVTLVAPPGTGRHDAGGRLRAFATAALHLTAPGEIEPIAGRPSVTRPCIVCCFSAAIGLLFFWRTDGGALSTGGLPNLALPLAVLLLAASDAGLLEWARGRVYAGPFTCIRVRPMGGTTTITGPAAALILLRNWNASGVALVAGGQPLPRSVEQRARPMSVRFRLFGDDPASPTHVAVRPTSPLVHALAAWCAPKDLRAFADTNNAAELPRNNPSVS